MVSSTCGCKEYFEEDRSDTQSLRPARHNTLVFTPVMVPPMAVHDMHIPPPPPVAPLPNPEPAVGYPMPVFQQPAPMQMLQPALLTGGMAAAQQVPALMPGVLYPPQPPMGVGVPVVQFPQAAYAQPGAGMMPLPAPPPQPPMPMPQPPQPMAAQVPQGMPGMPQPMPGMPQPMPGMPGMGAGRPGLPVFGTPNGQPNPIGPPGVGLPGQQPPFVMPPMAVQNQPF